MNNNNTILVIPNNIKNSILLKLNDDINIHNLKIMNLEELINMLTFAYNEETIYYLMKKYNIKYDVATIYLENLKYVDDKIYNNGRLDKLVRIKKDLFDKNLLYKDDNINIFLENKEIVVYGYDHINKFELSILNSIGAIIKEKEIKNYKHNIYEFNDISDEVEFVACKIIDLINDGVDINNIKITGYSDEYYNDIKRIFKFYNIPVSIKENGILDTCIISDFIDLIKDNNINDTLEKLKNKYDLKNERNGFIYNKLINILNKYTFVSDYKDVIDMLIHDFKIESNYSRKLNNYVEITSLKDNIFDDDKYVFVIGFNQGKIPIIYKDEDYISDLYKENLLIENTKEKNINEKKVITNIVRSIKNLTITYKLKSAFEVYYKSSLIDELDFNIIKDIKIDNKYSNKMNYIKLSKYLDEFIKYGTKNDELDLLYSNYSDIKYLKFNNRFKGISKDKLIKKIDNNLLLSYSSIDNYYRCGFRYYLNNILKLSEYDETFMIKIGNIFHYILSKCFEDNFNFEDEYDKLTKEVFSSNKEIFFISKLKEELLFIIDTIKHQNKFSSLDEALYENKIFINKEGNIKLTFVGIIDKLLMKKDKGNTYLVIIDYKTGNPNINLNNVIYGIDMQLPVYVYLANNKIENAKVIGFYLQKILNTQVVRQTGKTYEKLKKDNLKLQGYSIDNQDLIGMFDSTYRSSEVIKSMKVGNNGFYAYSKILSQEKINKLIDLTKSNIDTAFKDILDCKFDINPKRIGTNLIGCEFCKYKDICYMKEENIVNLKEYKNLEFLK